MPPTTTTPAVRSRPERHRRASARASGRRSTRRHPSRRDRDARHAVPRLRPPIRPPAPRRPTPPAPGRAARPREAGSRQLLARTTTFAVVARQELAQDDRPLVGDEPGRRRRRSPAGRGRGGRVGVAVDPGGHRRVGARRRRPDGGPRSRARGRHARHATTRRSPIDRGLRRTCPVEAAADADDRPPSRPSPAAVDAGRTRRRVVERDVAAPSQPLDARERTPLRPRGRPPRPAPQPPRSPDSAGHVAASPSAARRAVARPPVERRRRGELADCPVQRPVAARADAASSAAPRRRPRPGAPTVATPAGDLAGPAAVAVRRRHRPCRVDVERPTPPSVAPAPPVATTRRPTSPPTRRPRPPRSTTCRRSRFASSVVRARLDRRAARPPTSRRRPRRPTSRRETRAESASVGPAAPRRRRPASTLRRRGAADAARPSTPHSAAASAATCCSTANASATAPTSASRRHR